MDKKQQEYFDFMMSKPSGGSQFSSGGNGGEGRFKSKYSFLYLTFRFLYYKLRKHRALF